LLWQKTLGGSGYDAPAALAATNGGNYAICGTTRLPEGVAGEGLQTFWVLKVNASGSILWQSTYAGTGDEVARTIHVLDGGNILISGNTCSKSQGDATTKTNIDAALLCISPGGALLWRKELGTPGNDSCNFSLLSSDGSLVCAGSSYPVYHGVVSDKRTGWLFKTTPVSALGNIGGELEALRTQIIVFPNPTKGDIQLTLPAVLRSSKVSVTDVDGNQVPVAIESQGTVRHASLAGLSPGVYYLNVDTETGRIPCRVVLE
jgi:hypothetical protein